MTSTTRAEARRIWHVCGKSGRTLRPCLAFALVVVIPCAARAQAWKAAYDARQFGRAATLLHDIVSDSEATLRSTDPDPFERLALMYARGQGVPRDPVAACALFHAASDADAMGGGMIDGRPLRTLEDYEIKQTRTRQIQGATVKHCATLSEEDRLAALGSTLCFAFGMPESVLAIGGQTVRVGRRGIRPARAAPSSGAGEMPCLARVVRVRAFTIEPPPDAVDGIQARHFVEVVGWQRGYSAARASKYVMAWQLFEVVEGAVFPLNPEALVGAEEWPSGNAVPDVSLEMIRSGHVRWKIDGAPPKRGWVMLRDHEVRR